MKSEVNKKSPVPVNAIHHWFHRTTVDLVIVEVISFVALIFGLFIQSELRST